MKIPNLRAKFKPKGCKGNIHFGKIVLSLMLIFTMVLGNVKSTMASGNTKIMTVTIGEGGVDQNVLSKTVTIPNLKEIVNVSVDTGRINHSVNGDKVVLNASGGNPSRSVENPKKYSKIEAKTLKRDNNNFPSSVNYAEGGYVGTLYRDSEPRRESVYMELWSGFGLFLSRGAALEDARDRIDYVFPDRRVSYEVCYWVDKDRWGYAPDWDPWDPSPFPNVKYCQTVTFSASPSVIEVDHLGRTKYESGARLTGYAYGGYEAKYKGTVYKSGYDKYYKYKVIIEYIDNSSPTIEISSPSENSYFV